MSHLSSPCFRFPFVPLLPGSGYSASCSSFQPSIGSASQRLSQRPGSRFRSFRIFPVPDAWFPVRLSRFCLFGFPVCSLSLFPASLPQPFHRCSSFLPVLPFHPLVRPCVRSLSAFLSVRVSLPLPFVSSGSLPFCFHPGFLQSFRFAPVRLGLRYLVSASSFPCFKLPPHSGFHSAVPLSASFPWLPSFRPTLPTFVSSGLPFRLPTSFSLSVLFCGSFSAVSSGFCSLPFGCVPSPASSALVLGSAALPFTAPGFASQLLLPFAFPPSQVWAFPFASFFPFVSSGSAFRPLRSGRFLPLLRFLRLRFGLLGAQIHPEN